MTSIRLTLPPCNTYRVYLMVDGSIIATPKAFPEPMESGEFLGSIVSDGPLQVVLRSTRSSGAHPTAESSTPERAKDGIGRLKSMPRCAHHCHLPGEPPPNQCTAIGGHVFVPLDDPYFGAPSQYSKD